MDNKEIIENNREIINKVVLMIQENKINLSDLTKKVMVNQELTQDENEVLFYAKFMYSNNLIDAFGKITKEGIECLYH